MFLARATQDDFELLQFDVCTAFLYGELEKEIFMKIPQGLDVKNNSASAVCRLRKSLYGLKQVPRCWNATISEFLRKFSLVQYEADPCVYGGMIDRESVYLALFVDDGLIACKSLRVIEKVVEYLKEAFEMTIGNANKFVGLQIARNRKEKSMMIYQSDYAEKILKKFRMDDAKAVSVPADPQVALKSVKKNEKSENSSPYREAVGSLMFLSVVSCPDIPYAVNSDARFLENHNETHWRAVKRVFAYLNGTRDLRIVYRNGGKESSLVGYSDADYEGDLEMRRSTTGYAFNFANGLVTWSTRRQKMVTLSTTESE